MGGRAAKIKGSRVERVVRDYFRERGYVANRIPCSGAHEAYKGDVEVMDPKTGESFKIEVKARKSTFDNVYKLYMNRVRNRDDVTVRFSLPGGLVAFGPSFEEVAKTRDTYFHNVTKENSTFSEIRTYKSILNLKRLIGECQYLAIRQDRSPILFLKFWS